MRILKLHTTASTNSYLKDLIKNNNLENFTIVTTNKQTDGRGQRGNSWYSQPDKNLIFSMFVDLQEFSIDRQFELNQAISLAIVKVFKNYYPSSQIKWPNDIMADNYKIGGILIENTVSRSIIKHSIVGIGLNINQTEFPTIIPNASSLKNLINKDIELEELLQKIVGSIKDYIISLEAKPRDFLKEEYLENLYLWNNVAWYKDTMQNKFKGKIVGISTEGKLQIELSSKEIKEFNFKEVEFLLSTHESEKKLKK
jgi:BirA family biotin operon repressor/biotin-[acetyl-CoA-carboxylase] ligase